MAAALSAITANLNPAGWVKTTSTEDNALSFEKWITKYEWWESICCGGLGHTSTQRWNFLLSVGGSELEDIILHQAKILVKAADPVDPVQALEEQKEVRDAQGNVTQEHRPAVRAVIGKNAVVPTNWDEGIAAIKMAIAKYSNQVMARYNSCSRCLRQTTCTGGNGARSSSNRRKGASGRSTRQSKQL